MSFKLEEGIHQTNNINEKNVFGFLSDMISNSVGTGGYGYSINFETFNKLTTYDNIDSILSNPDEKSLNEVERFIKSVYENLHVICFSNDISPEYDGNLDTIFISDFMIDYPYRNEGIGTQLARYILDFEYKNKNIILQPDGDGNWFWKKFDFVNDEISQHMTWILKRNENINVE